VVDFFDEKGLPKKVLSPHLPEGAQAAGAQEHPAAANARAGRPAS